MYDPESERTPTSFSRLRLRADALGEDALDARDLPLGAVLPFVLLTPSLALLRPLVLHVLAALPERVHDDGRVELGRKATERRRLRIVRVSDQRGRAEDPVGVDRLRGRGDRADPEQRLLVGEAQLALALQGGDVLARIPLEEARSGR